MCIVKIEREHLHHLHDVTFVVCLIKYYLVIGTASFKSYLNALLLNNI